MLREAIALPTPIHITRLVLALLAHPLPLILRRMSRRRRILTRLHAWICLSASIPIPARTPSLFAAQPAHLARDALRRRLRGPWSRARIQRRGIRRRRRHLQSMFHFVDSGALLPVQLGFVRAVCVDAAFGEEVGAAARDDERCPAVAVVWEEGLSAIVVVHSGDSEARVQGS